MQQLSGRVPATVAIQPVTVEPVAVAIAATAKTAPADANAASKQQRTWPLRGPGSLLKNSFFTIKNK